MPRRESIPSASNRHGISNVLLFTLGTYPEVTEEESQARLAPQSQ